MSTASKDWPRLQRSEPKAEIGIVHFGPGAFFKSFCASYTDEAMAHSGGDWGICAVSMRSQTAKDALEPQGGCFTSVTLADGLKKPKIIHSISKVLVAPDDPALVVAQIADPKVKIVTLTITEKGYCHQPATGKLDLEHPDIAHDLVNLAAPKSAIGFIVAGLSERMENQVKALTVLPCDNLPSNGALARGLVLEFAVHIDPKLAEWIEENATFPATMVDRITPAIADNDIEDLADQTGYFDPACVVHEDFRQWVIEDKFVDGRPSWETAGAQFVPSVEAHETMKLRCLNGTHSALAYLGYLGGFETIAECVADEDYSSLCEKLWKEEIVPVVPKPSGEDLEAYCARLMDRYRDRSIRHRTWQIAMDGSQKLPQRLLGTISDNLAKGHLPEGLCLAVAGWMKYVQGTDEKGQPIDVRDPMKTELQEAAERTDHPVSELMSIADIFPTDLAANRRFSDEVELQYQRLTNLGARKAVRQYVQG